MSRTPFDRCIDGAEYYYGKYDRKGAETTDYFEYDVFGGSYSLQNGVSVGMTMEEVIEKYPDRAVMNFDGSYLDKEAAGLWRSTVYLCKTTVYRYNTYSADIL